MQLHRDSNQVRSARMTWLSSSGSANSIHSRGKPSATSFTRLAYGVVSIPCGTAHYGRRMRLGVLDVGSNTVHLLVVDAHPGAHPWPAHSQKERLRLAEQLDGDGALTKSGAQALIEACAQAKEASERLEVDEMLAFATSAVRDASNSAEVLRNVWLETGVDLRVLSG